MKQKIVKLTESQLADVIAKTIAREKLNEEIKESEKMLSENEVMQNTVAIAGAATVTIGFAVKCLISSYKQVKQSNPEMPTGQAILSAMQMVVAQIKQAR